MAAESTTASTPVAGSVRLHGEAHWTDARFAATSPSGHARLYVQSRDAGAATVVELRSVTSLDEILTDEQPTDAPAMHHVELHVDGVPFLEARWPPEFTALVVAGLTATLDDPTVVTLPAPTGPPAIAVPAAATAPVAESSAPASTEPSDRRRSRAMTGVIGALALIGTGALVVGALTLDHNGGSAPKDTVVLSQTTVRESSTTTTTAPSTTTTTTTPDAATTTTTAA
ncbi:MAG: hypothetical protein U0Q22_15025 [Acidimicrobiales bacterium]